MRFHVADGIRRYARGSQSGSNGSSLSCNAGCGVAHLSRAIVVDGRTFNDGIDAVPILLRL